MSKQTDPIRRNALLVIVIGLIAVLGFAAFDYRYETGVFRKESVSTEDKKKS